MKCRQIKYIVILVIILSIIFLYRSCYNLFANAEQEIYTSPKGTNTIIVQYDFLSCPTVYKEGLLWNKKIWAYPGSGFMETVHFGVEWLSENEIRFDYDDLNDEFDEEYFITVK